MSNNIIDQAEQSINSHAAISGNGKQSDSGISPLPFVYIVEEEIGADE
jgi:hypothetical protein